MWVVYNNGGINLHLSKVGERKYRELAEGRFCPNISRTDYDLVKVIKILGKRASDTRYGELMLKEIPYGHSYRIIHSYGREVILHTKEEIENSNQILKQIADLEREQIRLEDLIIRTEEQKEKLIRSHAKQYQEFSFVQHEE